MKAAGFFLLFTGFVIVLSAFALLSTSAPRAPFVWAGIAVQLLGLVLTFRSHLNLDEEQ
jgi:divalent metal cation (Fe/Co/Zn/Cd) transporter